MSDFEDLVVSAKKAAAAMRDADIPFVLAGGLAFWARGGAASDHDVDFVVREENIQDAVQILRSIGMKIEEPPEEWLCKAWDDDVMIDLIFRLPLLGNDEIFDQAEMISVNAVQMPVLTANHILISKLGAMNQNYIDYVSALQVARALREQIDWDVVRSATSESPFAKAFFSLLEDLEILN